MKYEYLVRRVHSANESLGDELNARGAEGWELVSCQLPDASAYFLCAFKRAIGFDWDAYTKQVDEFLAEKRRARGEPEAKANDKPIKVKVTGGRA